MARNFGLIGAGLFGEMHARAYSSHPEARLAVVCDLDRRRAEELASKYGGARACDDWRELAVDDSVEAVSIATPDFAHTEIALALAKAGKHLLIEKPLAMNVTECEAIVSAAKAGGVKLMVDFHNRWNPVFHEANRRVRAGEIGPVRFVYCRLSNTTFVPLRMLSWADRSSVLWFLGSHAIDIVCWLIGEWPARVYSVSRREVLKGRGVDTPDLFLSTLEFPGGAVASIENVWLLPETMPSAVDFECQLIGGKGSIRVKPSLHAAIQVLDERGVSNPDVMGAPTVHGKSGGFQLESIWHFVDCVAQDKEPLTPGEVGLEVTRIACAIEQSAATGVPVELRR